MAMGDPYVTLEELKDYCKIPLAKESYDEALLEALMSSTREINRMANRQFNRADDDSFEDPEGTERSFYPGTTDMCYVHDFYTTEGLVVTVADEVWPSEYYELQPLNGIVDGEEGWPFWKIKALDDSGGFPLGSWRGEAPVKVTAKWGWAEVPDPIRQACKLMAAESFQMKDAPFGVAGMDQFGTVLRIRDNRIAAGKIARYSRGRIQVG